MRRADSKQIQKNAAKGEEVEDEDKLAGYAADSDLGLGT